MNKIMMLADKAAVTKQILQMQEHMRKADNEADINVTKENLDIAKGMFEVLSGLDLLTYPRQIRDAIIHIENKDNEIISQLQSLKKNAEDSVRQDPLGGMWKDDVKALEYAINILKKSSKDEGHPKSRN